MVVNFVLSAFVLMLTVSQAHAASEFETYNDPYFGITVERPANWYIEGDDPWSHSHITPWHLPMIPIKELQPTAADILPDGKKTLILNIEPADETSVYMQLSVEKMPFGTTLEGYIEHTLERLRANNENLRVDEVSHTTLDGSPATQLVIDTGDEYPFKTIQVISLYGNLAYILQYSGDEQEYYQHLAVFQHLVEDADVNPAQSYGQLILLPLAGTFAGIAVLVAAKTGKKESHTRRFLKETKRMLPSAFGIEILCVASAEIGGLIGLWTFGFNPFGITMAYTMAYALAGFVTFTTIIGRKSGAHDHEIICGCELESGNNFSTNLKETFKNFAAGLPKLVRLYRNQDAWRIVKASLIVLVSAESGCIIAAATIDVLLYQYSAFLSIPAALFAGTMTVALIAARRSLKHKVITKSAAD